MGQRGRQQVGGEAQRVRGLIEGWREAGRPGKQMPEELWQAAVSLAREHGACKVASEVGVDYGTLRRRVGATPTAARGSGGGGEASRGGFVDIDVEQMLAHAGNCSTEVEVQRRDGSRLKIRLAPGQQLDVGAVTAAFVGGRR